ncbi:hypothetical protein [Pedobacter miscanthi]|uniref:Zinc-finger domain-containing protein n=1 Tax=Pedobacter miscanthi TaxID=2259170 RepID=A0A366L443_9SPHI|nr:hypothetical protein [Pedobacter miscanthi]RBQ07912.1 hypothetical protein DRW42_09945 [Pedobacter miscanthi]
MKETEIRKIAYNCRKATFLIEKQQLTSITIREKLELKIHLAGCSICRTFMQQSIAINKMVYNLFHSPAVTDLKLDDRFKEELQGIIDEKLNKS